MQYVLSSVLVLVSLFKKKSKLLSLTFFFLLCMLWGFNTGNADYENYELIYYGYYPDHEYGFMVLVKLFNYMGFTYQQFRITISLIAFFLLFRIIRKYTEDGTFVVALYFIFPFMLDVVQIRNFLVMIIILNGFQYLLSDNKRDILKYIFSVLLASSIHYSSIFYLILIFAKFMHWKKLLVFFSLTGVLGVLVAYTNFLPYIMFNLFDSSKVLNWFNERAQLGFLIPIALQLIGFLIVYISYYKFSEKNKVNMKKNEDQKLSSNEVSVLSRQSNLMELVLKVNIVLFIVFAFYIFNVTFFRLYRNILILNFIIAAIAMRYAFNNKYERLFFGLFLLAYAIMLMYYFIIYSNTNSVLIPIFENNIFFK